jgi:regulation of enolase protein 1 (concanavalin A-like superfamily)
LSATLTAASVVRASPSFSFTRIIPVTYQQFYDQCNVFINAVNSSDISADHRQRMLAAVFDVVDLAQERQRNGKPFA